MLRMSLDGLMVVSIFLIAVSTPAARGQPGPARRALALIWTTIERLQGFPSLGMQTDDPGIRQIVVRFGASGYIIRYAVLPETSDVLITRIWHGREARV